jgi:hypothetical protein
LRKLLYIQLKLIPVGATGRWGCNSILEHPVRPETRKGQGLDVLPVPLGLAILSELGLQKLELALA